MSRRPENESSKTPKWIPTHSSKTLYWALVLSLLLHGLLLFITSRTRFLDILKNQTLATTPSPPPSPDSLPPLIFVEVSPQAETIEPLQDTPFYSDRSSSAASDSPPQDSSTLPNLQGTQEDQYKTEDIPLPTDPLVPSQPTPDSPAQQPAELAEESPQPVESEPPPQETPAKEIPKTLPEDGLLFTEPKPKPPEDLKPLTSTPPAPKQQPLIPPSPPPRPRTVAEARQRHQQLAGQKMKLEGGATKLSPTTSFDTKSTTFGEYDRLLIAAIQTRWYQLIDQHPHALTRAGKVVVQFNLWPDGKITSLSVQESSAGDLMAALCTQAISDPAPYRPWPDDFKKAIQEPFREIRFTFYLN